MERLKRLDLVYLATPYTKYPLGIEPAFEAACAVTAALIQLGVNVYSPIAHTHPVAIHGGMDPLDYKIWLPFNNAIIGKSDAILVAKLPSWEFSFGIGHEIKLFLVARKPVFYLDPVTMQVIDALAEAA